MPTARQRARLDDEVLEATGDAEDPTASARLAGMLQRLQALRPAAPAPAVAVVDRAPAPRPAAPVSIAIAQRADDLFYDKGAATAEGFRPWYWSYEGEASDAESADLPAIAAGVKP